MVNVEDINNSRLKLVSLHNIDFNHPEGAIRRNIEIKDAQNYILKLTEKMINYKGVREYRTRSTTKEVIYQVIKLCTSFKTLEYSAAATTIDGKSFIENSNDIIANRLLNEQIRAEEKYANLTNITKGSLIQSLIELDNEYIYIIALIEHHKFIDDTDLKYKEGMPDEEKMALKSARIHLTKEGTVTHVFLSDTTKKITDYWCNKFLEVDESKDDITNTKLAYNNYLAVLRTTVSSKSQSDYSTLKNALNVYFLQTKKFSHDECVSFLFDNYKPSNSDLDLDRVKDKFSKCNDKNIFDNTFNIDPSDIKNKLVNVKYTLNDNIELKIKKPLKKMENGIYADTLPTGEKVLIINNVDEKTLKKFNFKNIDL